MTGGEIFRVVKSCVLVSDKDLLPCLDRISLTYNLYWKQLATTDAE